MLDTFGLIWKESGDHRTITFKNITGIRPIHFKATFWHKCDRMVVKNRTTSAPKSVPHYVLDKGHVLPSGILFLSLPVPE